MKRIWFLPILALASGCIAGLAQNLNPVGPAQGEPASQPPAPERAQVFLSTTDVLPHVADGGYWKTTITLHNNNPNVDTYTLTFYNSNGDPLTLDFAGFGSRSQIQGKIPGWGTTVIETLGTAEAVKVGWAYLESDAGYIKGYAIFRQQLPWRPYDFEAVVPMSASTEKDYVIAFDNTRGFTTSIAICNTQQYASNEITVTIYDESGAQLSQHTINLPRRGHTAFASDVQWPSTVNKRGTIRFQGQRITFPGPGVRTSSALGLRFNWTGPFTSTHPIEEW